MERMETKQGFGLPDIGIPFEVLFHPKLTHSEKILYGFIRNLAHSEDGCYATNGFLAGLIGVTANTISIAISKLKKLEIIHVEQKEDDVRRVYINKDYQVNFNLFLTEGGYMKINRGVLIKEYPSIDKIIGSSPLTYSKSILKKVNESASEATRLFDPEVFLEMFPEDWRDNPEFEKALDEFVQHRKELKRPLTKRAMSTIRNRLVEFPLDLSTTSLAIAVERGYIAPYPESAKRSHLMHERTKKIATGLTPADLFAEKLNPSYAKRFANYYDLALRLLADASNGQSLELARNMLTLRDHIASNQSEKAQSNREIPSTGLIIQDYTDWLSEQTWISGGVDPGMFLPHDRIFDRFLKEYSKNLGVHIISGDPYYSSK